MRPLSLLALLAALSGCGVVTHVRPVPRGSVVPELAVGGPLVVLGAPIPLPLATLGARYGLLDRLDLHAHAQLTPWLFGVGGLDAGATFLWLEEQGLRPALATTGRLYAFTNFSDGTLGHAELTATASWLLGDRFLTYATVTGLVAFLDGQVLWSPGVGTQVAFGRFALQVEARYYDPTYRTAASAVPYLNPGGFGALGLVLGFSYRLGGP